MKLWLIRPIEELGYDCLHGAIVRARTEAEARDLAQSHGGDETFEWAPGAPRAAPYEFWTDHTKATCVELLSDGEPGIIMTDVLHG